MDVGAHEAVIAPLLPLAGAQEVLRFGDAARSRHHQGPAEVSSGFIEHIGRVGGHDAGFCSGSNIDVVVAHGHVADRLQLRVGGEERSRHRLARGGEEAILAIGLGQQLIGAVDAVVLVGFDLEMLLQAGQNFREDGAGDEDLGFHAGLVVSVSLSEESGYSTQKNRKLMTMNSGTRMPTDHAM